MKNLLDIDLKISLTNGMALVPTVEQTLRINSFIASVVGLTKNGNGATVDDRETPNTKSAVAKRPYHKKQTRKMWSQEEKGLAIALYKNGLPVNLITKQLHKHFKGTHKRSESSVFMMLERERKMGMIIDYRQKKSTNLDLDWNQMQTAANNPNPDKE